MTQPGTRSSALVMTSPSKPWAALVRRRVLVLFACSILLRVIFNFTYMLPPGMDAGYYPLQGRSLVEIGTMPYSDLPLYFALVGGLGRLFEIVLGPLGLKSLGPAAGDGYILASRVIDSFGPPLVVLVLAWFGLRLREDRERANAAAHNAPQIAMEHGVIAAIAAPAVLAGASYAFVRTIADFQKQALAAVFLAAAIVAGWRAMSTLDRGGRASAVPGGLAAGLLLLTGLTHAATLAGAAPAVGLVLLVYVLRRFGLSVAAVLMLGAVGLALGAALVGVLLAAGSAKTQGIFTRLDDLVGSPMIAAPFVGGPVRMDAGTLAWMAAIHLVGAVSIVRLWRDRRATPAATVAVGLGCAAGSLVLVSPMLNAEYVQRLALIAAVPSAAGLACAMWTVGRVRGVWWPRAVVAVGAVSMLAGVPMLMRTMIPAAGVEELLTARAKLADPSRAVVIARHGVEFWGAYFLGTRSKTAGPTATAEALAKYDEVLFLRVEGGPGGPGGPGGRGRGRTGGPGGGNGGGMPPHMMEVEVPRGSESLVAGRWVRVDRAVRVR